MRGEQKKSQKGITLIALVVTIVVLLILAAISISMLTGENGIIKQAQEAKEETEIGEEKEIVNLAAQGAKENGYGAITKIRLEEELNKITDRETEVTGNGPFKVTYMDSKRTYQVETNGKVSESEDEGTDKIVPDSLGIVPEIDKEHMKPVKYEEGEWKKVEDLSQPGEWFEYSEKQWANVETENGYFVYIPRYAYKIISGYHQSLDTAGTIAIVFLNEDNTLKSTTDSKGNTVSESDLIHASEVDSAEAGVGLNATTKYIIHPAFEAFDTADKKVDGLWVAKYEMSREDKQEDGTWEENSLGGDIETSADIRMVSKPGVYAWNFISVTNMFKNCYEMNRDLDSHMMKNTEWGAVAYLTVSKYGKGATSEVENNNSTRTGYGADRTLSTGAASTTGDMYGIFDMAGGEIEYVAAYLNDTCVQSGGIEYLTNKNLIIADEKYKDVYQIGTSNTPEECFIANNLKVGDALWEVTSNTGYNGWYEDYMRFVGKWKNDVHMPVFERGSAYYDDGTAKLFFADGNDGCEFWGGDVAFSNAFRVVCVVE